VVGGHGREAGPDVEVADQCADGDVVLSEKVRNRAILIF
jgi:hypothetical protein